MSDMSARPSRRREIAGPGRLRSAASVLAVPLALAVVLGLGGLLDEPTPAAQPPREVDFSEVVRACPAAGWNVATGQLEPADATTLTSLGADGASPADLDPAAWNVTTPGGEAAVVRHDGTATGGVAFVGAAAGADAGGGHVVASCPRVTDDAWWVGLGSGGRHQSVLVLTNVSDVPAVADVRLWGTKGAVAAVEETGIVVEPGTTRRVPLEEVAAGEEELGLHVERRRGALVASVIDTSTSVLAGTEVPAAAAAPRREQVLTGVPGGGGSRTLLVANPTDAAALVSVDVLGAAGAFVPEGLADLSVPAGTVLALPVPETAGSDPAAWRVRSDQPVVASVRTQADATDFAYAVADEPWQDGAVLPVALGGFSVRPSLQLAAERSATVTVEGFDAAGTSVGSTSVDVTADATAVVDLASPELFAGDVAYLVARSTAPVRGTAFYRVGPSLAALSVADAPTTALSPRVRPGF